MILEKKIYAYQMNFADEVRIYVKDTNIDVVSSCERSALEKLIESLENLQRSKLLSENKKKRKEELRLIKKMNEIDETELTLKDYLFRVVVEEKIKREMNIKMPEVKLFKRKETEKKPEED